MNSGRTREICPEFKLGSLSASLAVLVIAASPASAERSELAVGLQGGLLLPGFSPTTATEITLATWSLGAVVEYGLLDDLCLTSGFLFSTFDASSSGYSMQQDGLEYSGTLWFSSRVYHLQVGAKYKLFSGYALAPYLNAGIGYAWSTFHGGKLTDSAGAELGVPIGDFAQGAFMVSAGVSVDYRIVNLVFVGLGITFNYALGDELLKSYLSVPLQATYYW